MDKDKREQLAELLKSLPLETVVEVICASFGEYDLEIIGKAIEKEIDLART